MEPPFLKPTMFEHVKSSPQSAGNGISETLDFRDPRSRAW